MLRARKKDVRIKPNRKLDKRSSRGMLYENEELRLRTIEINAEVERGQSDVKKLRRENDHLRREMWVLRDEYERLENLIKQLDLVPGAIGGSTATSCGSHPDSLQQSDSDAEDVNDNGLSAEGTHYYESETCHRYSYGGRYRRNQSAEINDKNNLDDIYVEADGTNPDADNLENYQKVYGRMPTHYCNTSLQQPPQGMSSPHGEDLEPSVPADPSDDHEPDYPAHYTRSCSQPHLLRRSSTETFAFHAVNSIPTRDPFSSTAAVPTLNLPSSPLQAEGAEFNFDQLVNIVQSFNLDQQQHEQGCSDSSNTTIAPPHGFATVRRHCHTVVERKEVRNHGGQTQVVRESVKEMALATPPVLASPSSSNTAAATSQSVIFTQTSSSNAGTSGIRQSVTFRQDSVVVIPNHSEEISPSAQEGGSYGASGDSENQLVCSGANLPYVRLHAIDPHTVSFNLSDHQAEWSKVNVQEIIDELERQLDATLCSVNGVRLTNDRVFISLKERQSLGFLLRKGFNLRGIDVKLMDITDNAVLVILTGVPHYISDSTVIMLLSAFGTVIGELERRFYKGVDTGERLMRLKVKAHTKLPKHVTVGGCKIIVKLLPLQDFMGVESGPSRSCPTTILRFKPGQNQENQLQHSRPVSCLPAESVRESQNPQRHSLSAALSVEPPVTNLESQDSDAGFKQSIATIDITPRIDKAFEYRSQLSVNLRLSTELPAPAEESSNVDDSKSRISCTETPPSPMCDIKLHPLSPQGLANVQAYQRQTPTRDLSRFRKNAADFSPSLIQRKVESRRSYNNPQRTPEATPPPPSTIARLKDSPPKTRVSVNFEECQSKLRPCAIPKPASASPNGILRKNLALDDTATVTTIGSDSVTVPGTPIPPSTSNANRKSGSAESGKQSCSFSLVDTLRSRSGEKKRAQDGPVDNPGTHNDNENAASHVRRDSEKSSGSSSKSSRSSRKSGVGELPWCGCWGNGCL